MGRARKPCHYRAMFRVAHTDEEAFADMSTSPPRISLLGLYRREVLYVAYTERGDNIRIISARRAERHEQDRYYRQNAP